MFESFFAAFCLACPSPGGPPLPALPTHGAIHPFDEKAVRALEAWLKLYRSGKIDYRLKDDIGKDSIAVRFGITPKNAPGHSTWAGDLKLILDAVAKLDDGIAAAVLLEVAAVGMDNGKYTVEMAPYDVRSAGEASLASLRSNAAKDELVKVLRGDVRADKNQIPGLQAAAVRALGRIGDLTLRTTIETALGDNDDIVRVHAAEALAALGHEDCAPSLVAVLERDTSEAVLIAAANSLRTLYAKYVPSAASAPAKVDGKPAEGGGPAAAPAPAGDQPTDAIRLAVRGAIAALGRTTWRADMALVRLLADFRSLESVPALITVLERFRDQPQEIKSGKLSGLLLYQVHELLVSMTGAVFPANQPDKWRELWDRERDKMQVVAKPMSKGAEATAAGGFCGIPVQGTRVVFVLDLSGSMDFDMDDPAAEGKKKLTKRLDFAKRELTRAMDLIAPNAFFNLVTFNGDDKAEVWSKELVPANERNRERFKKHVEGLRALGGTNVWAGLQEALKLKSLTYGTRYESNVDEVFILSDGAPSVGEVQDPVEILRIVQEANRFAHMRINTIFISSATPPEYARAQPPMSLTPQELMKRMAEQNRGKFREL